jgi:hypothetical protein
MALDAIGSLVGGVIGLFKEDPQVAAAKAQAAAQKHVSNNNVKMNTDNNDTKLEMAAMNYERSDISESRWLNFTYDTTSAPFSYHAPCSGYFPLF